MRLRDVSKVASTIDLLVGAGATDIGGINFMVSEASKLLDDAREQAVADARRKAEIYARAAGVTLGAPLNISENGGSPGPVFRAKMMAAPMAATPVAQGEETLSVTVSVTWAIKQAGSTPRAGRGAACNAAPQSRDLPRSGPAWQRKPQSGVLHRIRGTRPLPDDR